MLQSFKYYGLVVVFELCCGLLQQDFLLFVPQLLFSLGPQLLAAAESF